jgi:hypothetical protein
MPELWKDINGFEGIYKISNTGKVKNNKTGIIKKEVETVLIKQNTRLIIKTDNLVKTHYPELIKKEIIDFTKSKGKIGTLVEKLPEGIKLPIISIEGIEYTSYRDAANKLNMKESIIKRRVSGKKYTDYFTL